MSSKTLTDHRLLGTLRAVGGTGIVRVEDRFDTDIDDLWSALTEPRRLARWIAEVKGDLRLGGEFSGHFFATGWEGTGRVEVCEPPRRLVVRSQEAGESAEQVIEATLTADGDQTVLVIEERGMPLDQLAAYGAGWQIHVEDLTAYLSGQDRRDAKARWDALLPAYRDVAIDLG